MTNEGQERSKDQRVLNERTAPSDMASAAPEGDAFEVVSPNVYRVIDSPWSACLIAFTGGSLDAFLFLNHGHVFAGVMSGNAVLLGLSLFTNARFAVFHYLRPLVAYVLGIFLIAMFQRKFPHHSVRLAFTIVILGLLVLSLVPPTFPDETYIFLVVLLTGFMVGIARRVHSYSYNATVLTGTLRDATMSLVYALNPIFRTRNLQRARDLWSVVFSQIAGAAAGGLLARHIGNYTLWVPAGILAILLVAVLRVASGSEILSDE
jgi:uncharacterized membrane protein YoaK (UPF0700 family)